MISKDEGVTFVKGVCDQDVPLDWSEKLPIADLYTASHQGGLAFFLNTLRLRM